MNSYPELEKYLENKTRIGINFGLARMEKLMSNLGFPNKQLRCIHIAGTNGKGSVAAILSSILNKAKIKTGLYTSPHLVNVRERIRLQEDDITEDELLKSANKIISAEPDGVTYFEFLTAAAIEFFARHEVKLAIMEVGMGGRLDATNVCYGEIAVITDISLDHTEYLGNTIDKIRAEKMGIVKSGAVVLSSEDISNEEIKSFSRDLALIGIHQKRNCLLALKVIDVLREKGFNISEDALGQGLAAVRWPGRFQVLSAEPMIVLDGAHNPSAALALKDTAESFLRQKAVLIVGVLKDKDCGKIMEILSPLAKKIITVTPNNERAISGRTLKTFVKNVPVEYMSDVMDALDKAKKDPPVIVTGSLYLVGEVLSRYKNQYENCYT